MNFIDFSRLAKLAKALANLISNRESSKVLTNQSITVIAGIFAFLKNMNLLILAINAITSANTFLI